MPLPMPVLMPLPLSIPLILGKHFLESPRESLENHRMRYMVDADDSQVILKLTKNHPENHHLKIAILLLVSAAVSLTDLKIQLRIIELYNPLLHLVVEGSKCSILKYKYNYCT